MQYHQFLKWGIEIFTNPYISPRNWKQNLDKSHKMWVTNLKHKYLSVGQKNCTFLFCLTRVIFSDTVFSSIGALEMAMSVGRSVGLSFGRCHLAFYQHLVHVAGLFSLVQSGLDQCRPIQSTLVYSSQIQSNLVIILRLVCLCHLAFQQHLVHVATLFSLVQSGLDQCRPIQSILVKSTQIQVQSNLVKSRKILSRLFLAAYSACGGSLQSRLDQ